jgi:hypothetical protein
MAHNACIVSYFMPNINQQTVRLQQQVVEKFNKSKYPHYSFQGDIPHGAFIDYFWGLNGADVATMKDANLSKQFDHDIVVILDIDAIPLSEDAIDYLVEQAAAGKLIGNAQRTNHLKNDQHVFAAPSATAISRENFIKIGCPSALETDRGDVLEEYTFKAEENQIKVDLLLPLRYDNPPQRYAWEGDQPPYWALADGMPVYGMGTTYGLDGKDMFYHNFQIRMPGQEERFWNKCNEVLNG